LESVWRQTGHKPKELSDLLTLPDSCSYVWSYFKDLHTTRTGNGFGASPITFTEMKAYFDLLQIEPDEWELVLLRKFDNLALDIFAKAQEKNSKGK
jgi:hypothetical protein